MKVATSIQLIIVLAVLSCKQQKKSIYSHLLPGDWKHIQKDTSSNSLSSSAIGYQFLPNGVCHKNPGYFKRVTSKIPGMENAFGDRTEETKIYYLGTETTYKIQKDSLIIYNLADSVWEGMKIISITSDTMNIRMKNDVIVQFTKNNSAVDSAWSFDEVVVSASGCMGYCPINNIYIKKSREAIYYGERFNTKNGFYKTHLSENQYNQIISNFNKASIQLLNENYEATWTDDEAVTMTFLKNGKVLKTITDYGNVAPNELIWAYTHARNIYQLTKLDSLSAFVSPTEQAPDILFYLTISLGLSKSESFYLWNLLREAKQAQGSKTKINELNIVSNKINEISKIETDGRYYKFKMTDGELIILDIGINFLKINSRLNRANNK